MTSKEKAIELVIKYVKIYNSSSWFYISLAKEASLITVNEILNLNKNDITKGMYISITKTDEIYWEEVKQEIMQIKLI